MPRAPLPTRPLGTTGLDLTTVGFGAWAAAAVPGPTAGARRMTTSPSTPCAARSRSASTGSTPRPSMGWATPRKWSDGCSATCPRRSGRYVFTKGGLVWMSGTGWQLLSDAGAWLDPAEVRSLAPPPRCRAHRSVSGPLARRRRHADRGVVGRDGAPGRRRQGAGGRRLQLRRRPARALRGHPPRGFVAAAVLAHPARGRQGRDPLVR